MMPNRAWVLLKSGRRINLLDPQPEDWEDSDLAIGLSRTYRWGGHSRWELPLSVAQHSLLVLVLRRQLERYPLTTGEALAELLHDAAEGLLGFDPIAPVKPHLGESFAVVDTRLQAAIARRYQVPDWTTASYRRHKLADRLAAASEALHVAGWGRDEIRDSLLIPLKPIERDPLPLQPGFLPWEPWPPQLAATLFLDELYALLASATSRPRAAAGPIHGRLTVPGIAEESRSSKRKHRNVELH